MWGRSRVLLAILHFGCGRFGFDGDATDAAATSDGSSQAGDAPPTVDAFVASDAIPSGTRITFGETGLETYSNVTSDTAVYADSPTFNFGTSSNVKSDNVPISVGLLRFDLSAIPPGARPLAAELRIHVEADIAGAGATAEIYAAQEAWDEGTASGAVGAASYNERRPGLPWSGPGVTPPSRGTTVLAVVVPDFENTTYNVPLRPEGLAVIEGWIANPATNFGFVFPPPSSSGWAFVSSEDGVSVNRPVLVLDF